jgi:hypothetical protein
MPLRSGARIEAYFVREEAVMRLALKAVWALSPAP